jgi:hypothetical protein
MTTKAFTKMTRQQVIKAAALIEQHMRSVPDSDGVWAYDPEWSDARVAQEVGVEGKLPAVTISGLRLDLDPPRRVNVLRGMAALGNARQIEALESQVKTLQSNLATALNAISSLQCRFEKLCMKLSLDKVTDVRYLAADQEQKPNLKVAK